MNEMPKCPYCESEMNLAFGPTWRNENGTAVYRCRLKCRECRSEAPEVSAGTREEAEHKALAAAFHRYAPEGKNRVLRPEEVAGARTVWLEGRGREAIPMQVIGPYKHLGMTDVFDFLHVAIDGQTIQHLLARMEEYGQVWRCWRDRPTKEETEGTLWA